MRRASSVEDLTMSQRDMNRGFLFPKVHLYGLTRKVQHISTVKLLRGQVMRHLDVTHDDADNVRCARKSNYSGSTRVKMPGNSADRSGCLRKMPNSALPLPLIAA